MNVCTTSHRRDNLLLLAIAQNANKADAYFTFLAHPKIYTTFIVSLFRLHRCRFFFVLTFAHPFPSISHLQSPPSPLDVVLCANTRLLYVMMWFSRGIEASVPLLSYSMAVHAMT